MPTIVDVARFFSSQALGRTHLPTDANLDGKTIIVTGANTGLGLEACKHLARMNAACLVLACRSVQKGEEAKQTIYKETECQKRTTVLVWELDLSRQSSVQAFIDRVKSKDELGRVDGFVANAGVEFDSFTESEGMEQTVKVNVLSTIALCLGVLPRLYETSRSFNIQTHLTLVGSLIHYFGADRELHVIPQNESLYDRLGDRQTANMKSRYPLSKLMEHLCFNKLAASASSEGVIMNIVNPGWCGTDLSRSKHQPLGERIWFAILGRTAEEGSRTLVHGVCADMKTHGQYLSECRVKSQSTYVRSVRGQQMATRLYRETVKRLGV